ncbi:MAG TPA: hypothetical protein VNI77_10500 [Nitrososphaera sp.]|nr:hypothetical protein [Nitrososphaera sp.]
MIDLLLKLKDEPSIKPTYIVEAFIEEGANFEEIRNEVVGMTYTTPQFHDSGTHLVAHHRLDYDLLKQIQDHPGVKQLTGNYAGSDCLNRCFP